MTPPFAGWAIAGLAVLALALSPAATRADDDGDHDRARELYEQGDIHALHEIIPIVREHTRGDIVAVALVRVADKWVYRFQVIAPNGRRLEVDVDAGAAAVIEGQGGDR